MGDGAIVRDCDQWPILNSLLRFLVEAKNVFWAKFAFRNVNAWLCRDLEGKTLLNLSLYTHKLLLCLLPAVFDILLLCLPL